MKQLWTIAAIAVVLTACKSTPMNPAKVEDASVTRPIAKQQPKTNGDSNAGADTINIKTVDVDTSKDAQMDAAELAKRQIFFDYDSDAIREEYKGLIATHAKYLVAHAQTKVVLQGNTDERGTHEYNLALGQRRAVAVKTALNLLGVPDSQIETVSYGEERAKQNCPDVACGQPDRRVDIVYAGQ